MSRSFLRLGLDSQVSSATILACGDFGGRRDTGGKG